MPKEAADDRQPRVGSKHPELAILMGSRRSISVRFSVIDHQKIGLDLDCDRFGASLARLHTDGSRAWTFTEIVNSEHNECPGATACWQFPNMNVTLTERTARLEESPSDITEPLVDLYQQMSPNAGSTSNPSTLGSR